jgi:hypothetical protein
MVTATGMITLLPTWTLLLAVDAETVQITNRVMIKRGERCMVVASNGVWDGAIDLGHLNIMHTRTNAENPHSTDPHLIRVLEPNLKKVWFRRPCYHGRASGAKLSVLIAVFFFTSVVSVVTGSTSLITVAVMIALGIEANVAVATNMLALSFMSVGGSLPFNGRGRSQP